RGNPVVDGIGMLLHQARPGFHLWFGQDPEVTPQLRAHVLQGLDQ
ncbi:MAG: shikimate dehydrogenase, partial [Rhodospirillaceae bacterium]|nr:shikimate dehydrogenase [Rhodospirillaceae bacterium]